MNHHRVEIEAVMQARKNNDRSQALALAQEIVTTNPDSPIGYSLVIGDLLALGRREEARQNAELALAKFSDNHGLACAACDAYRAVKEPRKALEASLIAIATSPSRWEGYARASQDCIALKEFRDSCRYALMGVTVNPSSQAMRLQASYAISYVPELSRQIKISAIGEAGLDEYNIIAYSGDDYFDHLQERRLKHFQTTENKYFGKEFLFVAGLGRSGTTAMGKLLSLSAEVEMYTELYSPYRLEGYTCGDFKAKTIKEKLKLRSKKSSDLTTYNDRNKTSKFIGDKRPQYQFCAQATYDNLPTGTLTAIYAARPLFYIALSAHRRAVNNNDKNWPTGKGVEYTILLYNASCKQMNYLYKKRREVFDSFSFAWYSEVFMSTDSAIKLIEETGIHLTPHESSNVSKFIEDSCAIIRESASRHHDLELERTIKDAIENLLDAEEHEAFCKNAGIPTSLH